MILTDSEYMENFIKFSEITSPDRRNTYFVNVNSDTGEMWDFDIKDIYNTVSEIRLKDEVPEDVRSQFNIAKNLAVYSWFSYPFHQIAEMKAYSTLESALKIRFNKKRWGLGKLLDKAIDMKLVKDANFSHIANKVRDPHSMEYAEVLPELIPKFREPRGRGKSQS